MVRQVFTDVLDSLNPSILYIYLDNRLLPLIVSEGSNSLFATKGPDATLIGSISSVVLVTS